MSYVLVMTSAYSVKVVSQVQNVPGGTDGNREFENYGHLSIGLDDCCF